MRCGLVDVVSWGYNSGRELGCGRSLLLVCQSRSKLLLLLVCCCVVLPVSLMAIDADELPGKGNATSKWKAIIRWVRKGAGPSRYITASWSIIGAVAPNVMQAVAGYMLCSDGGIPRALRMRSIHMADPEDASWLGPKLALADIHRTPKFKIGYM